MKLFLVSGMSAPSIFGTQELEYSANPAMRYGSIRASNLLKRISEHYDAYIKMKICKVGGLESM